MRKPIIAANWKMNLTSSETESYLKTFLLEIGDEIDTEIVIIPPFTALFKASEHLSASASTKLGAQNMSQHRSGAFTGEISAAMLRELFVRYVVLGHSERRQLFGETDEIINQKLHAAHDATLKPIFCVGETLAERDAGQVEAVLSRQLHAGLAGMGEKEIHEIVVAYEPVWAIGTGRNATPAQAQEAHAFIRKQLAEIAGQNVADRVRIQYGGSVKTSNAAELLAQPDIDGALVGGASLDPRDFAEIVKSARAAKAG
ncbi:MAG: triose-phosphate isomerase [Verrucomicrobia bacterium]|nr:triose-phosphate isomerase [Verrucomicrobiota bacterium]MBV9656471.1 triose-phosphate isomerase [Verrucomicrobiota bacterium]